MFPLGPILQNIFPTFLATDDCANPSLFLFIFDFSFYYLQFKDKFKQPFFLKNRAQIRTRGHRVNVFPRDDSSRIQTQIYGIEGLHSVITRPPSRILNITVNQLYNIGPANEKKGKDNLSYPCLLACCALNKKDF